MSLSERELEGLLTGEVGVIIKKLLAKRKPAGEMDITEIEELVLGAGEEIEQLLTEALVEAEEAGRSGDRPACPACETSMRHRGLRERKLVTRTGEVTVRRRYYRCPDCGRGFFPPG